MNDAGSEVALLKKRRLEVLRFFGWLGFVGFGGPQAHIAMMQQEIQEKRQWLSKEEFNEALAVCNILPGPASTQMVTYLGWQRGGGLAGGLIAALAFILPAFTMVTALSWAYFSFGTVPQINALFYGLKPVVLAIVLATAWRLSQPFRGDWRFWLLLVISAVLIGGQFLNDFLVFVGAALAGWVLYSPRYSSRLATIETKNKSGESPATEQPPVAKPLAGFLLLLAGQLHNLKSSKSSLLTVLASLPINELERLLPLAWFFLRAGAVIFGGGLVIIPLIQNEIVEGFGWLTSQQFIDGAAIGQLTPGPVLTTAAFVGYAAIGVPGAFVATFCIFLPGLTFILLAAPILQKIRQLPIARAVLSGVNGAVVGSLVAGAYFISLATIFPSKGRGFEFWPIGITAIALFLSLRYKTNTLWLFLGGALAGLLLNFIR